jgi:hypothetical protein
MSAVVFCDRGLCIDWLFRIDRLGWKVILQSSMEADFL